MIFQLAPKEMILGLLSPVAALFVVGVGYGRLVRRIAERRQQRLAEAVQRAEERLSGIRTVRTFNAEPRELKGWRKKKKRTVQNCKKRTVTYCDTVEGPFGSFWIVDHSMP